MTKKHFKEMAGIIALIDNHVDRSRVEKEFSKLAKSLNPRFDEYRFRTAVVNEVLKLHASTYRAA